MEKTERKRERKKESEWVRDGGRNEKKGCEEVIKGKQADRYIGFIVSTVVNSITFE